MNEQQFEQVKKPVTHAQTVSISDLMDTSARTLLLGIGSLGETLHVYLDPAEWQIHVLRYVTIGAGADESALILSHTYGQNGGTARNADFLPSKWLYPESCDMEFCMLLRRHDVSLPFAKFDVSRRAHTERFNGFAGYVASGLQHAVKLATQEPINNNEFGDAQLMHHLLREACNEVGVKYTSWNGCVMIAEPDAPRAVAKAEEYYASISPAARLDTRELLETIRDKTIWSGATWGDDSYRGEWCLDKGGSLAFSLYFDEGARLSTTVPGAIKYEGENDVTALQGTYEGRPYFVVLLDNECGDDTGKIHVNLFGPPEKFIEELISRYKLVPVTDWS